MSYAEGSFFDQVMSVEGGFVTWSADMDAKVNALDEADLIDRMGVVEFDLDTLETTKQDKFEGTIAQYVRGDGSLATFPTVPSLPISISNVTGLQTALDGKASTSHSHAWGDITGKPSFATVSTTGNYYDLSTKPAVKSFDNAPTRTIQTTAAAANGWRLSTFRDSHVSYSVTIATSVSLSGSSTGYVVLEVAATNSTTASDWKEIARATSGQSGTLVIGLVLNQSGGGVLSGLVPANYFVRIRSVNTAGTPTYTVNGCQEVLDEPLSVAS